MAGVAAPPPKRKEPPTGLEAFCEHVKKVTDSAKKRKDKEDAFLAELGFKLTFDDVIALLKDEARLKKVVSKLKLKAFW